MNTSIPQNLSQCAFDFDDLNAQPNEHTAYTLIESPNAPMKQCNQCLQWKQKTTEFFAPEKRGKDGLRATCRECRNAAHRKPPKPPETERECKKCNIVKPMDQFTRGTSKTKNGTTTEAVCYDCKNEHRRQTRKDNPDLAREKDRKHYRQNIENIRARDAKRRQNEDFRIRAIQRSREWQVNNKDRARIGRAAYQQSHKEQIKEYRRVNAERVRAWKRAAYHRIDPDTRRERSKIWRQAHMPQILVLNRNRYARQKSTPGTHTEQEIRDQYKRQHGKCYYCQGKVKWEEKHVEHTFPLSREGARNSIDHLVIACMPCNLSKKDKYPWEWPEGGRLL
jgi:5-methylcytosine-specific restriction endonuclease McrA